MRFKRWSKLPIIFSMRKVIFIFIAIVATSLNINAQERKVSGRVIDEFSQPIDGVQIINSVGDGNVISDRNGCFAIKVSKETKILSIICSGYVSVEIEIGESDDLGVITMKLLPRMLPDVNVQTQVVTKLTQPVSVSKISAAEIEERLGTREFPEILQQTPGIHANKQGGGWGDSEIWMRGFDNTNVAIMVNGIPVNDMENNTVYWSNWAGLSDVTKEIQAQRGVGATIVSSPSIGGTINIVTKGLEAKKGGSVIVEMGNDCYNKELISYSTGMMSNGLSMTFLLGRSSGNGYIQGTDFKMYNYFVNISKKITESHQLSITAFGAPQQHYMRSYALTNSQWEYVRTHYSGFSHWSRYNPDYGFDNNKRQSNDYNVYYKPQVSFNHIWEISSKTSLSTTLYGSWGRGTTNSGESNSSIYSEESWYGAIDGVLNLTFRNTDGLIDYGMIENINASSSNGSELVMTQLRTKIDWYGLLSSFKTSIGDHIGFFGGIDARYYKGAHTNILVDLLGGEYYIDSARRNVDLQNNPNANDAWQSAHLGIGDVVHRDYDGLVYHEGVFGQLEYVNNAFHAFASGTINYKNYRRYDRMYYEESQSRSEMIGFLEGSAKIGAVYELGEFGNFYANAGYLTRAPQFKNGVFMSVNNSNIINLNAKNEKSGTAEVGYNFSNKYINMYVDVYYTEWIDKAMIKKGKMNNGKQYYMNMTGVGSRHLGAEVEVKFVPMRWIEIRGMASLGNWIWISDSVKGYAYDLYGQAVTQEGFSTIPGAENHAWAIINMKGVHIGGSAQTTAALDITFIPFDGLRIGGGYTYYDRNYAYYSISGSSLSLGKTMNVSEAWRIPASGVFDTRASYTLPFKKAKLTVAAQIHNVLNNYYVEKAWNPYNVGTQVSEVNKDDVYMFYSFGRIWSIRLKYEF